MLSVPSFIAFIATLTSSIRIYGPILSGISGDSGRVSWNSCWMYFVYALFNSFVVENIFSWLLVMVVICVRRYLPPCQLFTFLCTLKLACLACKISIFVHIFLTSESLASLTFLFIVLFKSLHYNIAFVMLQKIIYNSFYSSSSLFNLVFHIWHMQMI